MKILYYTTQKPKLNMIKKGVKLKSGNNGRRPFNNKDEFSSILVNHQIKSKTVRLIDEEGENKGVVETRDALFSAKDLGLDLIVVSDKSNPPVCKILDFSKYKYELKKQKKDMLKKQRENRVELKEIQLRPVTDTHDLSVKVSKVRDFIDNGDKVKIVVKFRGRELAFKDQGFSMLDTILEMAQNAKFESKPSFNGRNLIVILVKNT